MKRTPTVIALLATLLVVLLPLSLLFGSVDLEIGQVWQALTGHGDALTSFVVVETRLPAAVTAALAGAALALSGLMMQTCFNNPLAGPSVMGLSAGASLGVAVVLTLATWLVGVVGQFAVIAGAFAGAMGVLALLLVFSSAVRSADVLLIVGLLIGYLASSLISLLNFFAPMRSVHSFVMWGMGNFNGVGLDSLPLFGGLLLALMLASAGYIKSLNALLFGADYAAGIGISLRRVRSGLLVISGALTAVVTAWCGPIGFIGLIVPHIARMLTATSNHAVLLPATLLVGALTGLLCQILSVLPSASYGGIIPVNAITPVIGVPVIVYVLLNRRKLLYFN